MARAASSTTAVCEPLSLAPGATCVPLVTLVERESRCPPTTTSRVGSAPGIQAYTFRCVRRLPQSEELKESYEPGRPAAESSLRAHARAAPMPCVLLVVDEQELRVTNPTNLDRLALIRLG